MEKTRIAVSGAAGRMGRRIVALIAGDDECELTCALESEESGYIGRDAGEAAGIGATGVIIRADFCGRADVLIDFTRPDSSLKRLPDCVAGGVGAVVGTTGFSEEERRTLEGFGDRIPLLFAPNMSVGVNLMFRLAAQIASILGESYDIEIVESHHKRKKDAPSGTAMKIAESICEARGVDPEDVLKHGRDGITGPRPAGQIGMHAVRAGDIVGEHTVVFAGEGERMELTHRAGNRDVFAAGAINAAKFLKGRGPGLYGMKDMV